MKKSIMAITLAVASTVAVCAPASVQIVGNRSPIQYQLPPSLTNHLAAAINRAVCERAVMEDGKIIEAWREGSKTWVVTNTPVPVTGEKLKSTFTERMAKVEAEVAKWQDAWTNSQIVVEIQRRRAEKAEARFNTATNRLTIAINEAKLPTTKLLLQAILDAIIKASEASED